MNSFDPIALFAGGQQGIYLAPWDASTILGSDGVNPAAIDGAVSMALDMSGNNNHWSQTTSAYQSLLKVDGGGKRYLSFDGVDDFMSNSNLSLFSSVGGITVIALLRWRSSPTVTRAFFYASTPTIGATRFTVGGGRVANKHYSAARRLDADAAAALDSTSDISLQIESVTMAIDYSASSAKLRVNGIVSAESAAFLSAGVSDSTASNTIRIGRSSTTSSAVDIYGLLVAPRILPDADIINVENFLKAKAGI